MTTANADRAAGATPHTNFFDITRLSQATVLIGAGLASVLCWAGLAALILL